MSGATSTSTNTSAAANSPADPVPAAENCRWDGLHFGTCTFQLEEMGSWLDSVRAHMYTRKAAFMLTERKPGDDNLQNMCLLALKAALPAAKRPLFQSYDKFTAAFKALVQNSESARKAAALNKQAELVNMSMKSSETLVSYFDRAASLWGAFSDHQSLFQCVAYQAIKC
jgi:hypothetical protein